MKGSADRERVRERERERERERTGPYRREPAWRDTERRRRRPPRRPSCQAQRARPAGRTPGAEEQQQRSDRLGLRGVAGGEET